MESLYCYALPIDFLIKIAFIFLITAILSFVIRRSLNKLRMLPKIKGWQRNFLDTIYSLSLVTIWGYGMLFLLEVIAGQFQNPVTQSGIGQARSLFLVFIITWLLFIWKNKTESILISKSHEKGSKIRDETLISMISRILSVVLFTIAGITALGILNVDLTAIIAFGGLGGLAVSWAAKDVIANFFGGFMIHVNRPFSIGDWIKSPNKNFEGFVEQIGWYMTRIRTFERRPTYIPNALITDAIIENPGRMYHRRIRFTIGVRYQDYERVQPIIDDTKEMLRNHQEIVQSQILLVNLIGFNDHSIDIDVYCFTRKTQLVDFREVQQDILFKVGEIIKSHKAEIAFPTKTIFLEKT